MTSSFLLFVILNPKSFLLYDLDHKAGLLVREICLRDFD